LIKEVLKLVRDGGLLSKGDIADKMGIQDSTLESVFSLLSSKGYLKKFDGAKVSRVCIGCSMSKNCMQKATTGNVYLITEKGKLYLKTH
jgi:ribosomal protein S25